MPKDSAEQPPVIAVGDGAAIPNPRDWGLSLAWLISLLSALGLAVYLYVVKSDPYRAIFHFIVPDGLIVTFQVTVGGILLALIIGLFVGVARVARYPDPTAYDTWLDNFFRFVVKTITLLASIYVEVVRGIPLMVQLFYIYYAIARTIQVPALVAAVIALGFCYGAYMGEVFRAGIESVDHGQKEASLSLGFSSIGTFFYVTLPQAMRTILPPIGNEFIALLKDSTLVSVVAVPDIMRLAKEHASTHFNYFETYTMVVLIYLILTLCLSKLVSLLEGYLGNYAKR